MTITTTTLTRAAGLAAVAGGLLFIAVQINHPHLDATFTTTTEYAVRETMKIVMAVLSLIGITGIYLRQVKQTGVLGLLGYLLFGAGYLAILSIQVVGCVRPPLPRGQLSPATSTTSSPWPPAAPRPATSAHSPTFIRIGGFTYLAGGLVFGIALFRAHDPRPVGRSTPRRRRRRHRRDPPAAAAQPEAVRHPRRRRRDRPRLLPVARAAHPDALDP